MIARVLHSMAPRREDLEILAGFAMIAGLIAWGLLRTAALYPVGP